jgi:hypothetical protein
MITLKLLAQVIMKSSVGITSFGTVSRNAHTTRTFPKPPTSQVDCSNGLLSLMQVNPQILLVLLPCASHPPPRVCHISTLHLPQVMFEDTPTQYDIIIRNVSAAGAVVYNGSAAGNNMIGLKLRFA